MDFLFFDMFIPTYQVYAVRTNENRYAIFQVIDIEDGYYRIRYKTYEKYLPTVDITGHFRCLLLRDPLPPTKVELEPLLPPRSLQEYQEVVTGQVLDRVRAYDRLGLPESVKHADRKGIQFKQAVDVQASRLEFARLAPEAHRVGAGGAGSHPTLTCARDSTRSSME